MASCATCQNALRERARFCTRCGTPVGNGAAVAEPASHLPASVEPAPAVPEPAVPEPAVPEPAVFGPGVSEPAVPGLAPAFPEPSASVPAAQLSAPEPVPSRIPVTVAPAEPPRSVAAVGALVAGIAPLVISVLGNLVAAELARGAVAAVDADSGAGAWASVLIAISVVFVLTAGALTVCGILGARALRETASGAVRGRGLAIAGLATGGVNLVLWIAGLVVTVTSLGAILA